MSATRDRRTTTKLTDTRLAVRVLREADLKEADRLMRVAFGTFVGLPDPPSFMGDADYVRTRWAASPESAFAAEVGGQLVGSNFVTRWGSFGFFGPLSLDPSFWNRGLASRLVEPAIDQLDSWGVRQAGLFTFPESAKHIGLYQKFGFRPRSLTLIMEKAIEDSGVPPGIWSPYSQLDETQRCETLAECRHLTDEIYSGLDVAAEIESIRVQGLGETILLTDDRGISGFAACHAGPGTEAGSGVCYVKFGASAGGSKARSRFARLLAICESFARVRSATRLVLGVNAARVEAYEEVLSAGFRIALTGISMHRPNNPGFSRPGAFVIDDWR